MEGAEGPLLNVPHFLVGNSEAIFVFDVDLGYYMALERFKKLKTSRKMVRK